MTDMTNITDTEIDRMAKTGDLWDARVAPADVPNAPDVALLCVEDFDPELTAMHNDPKPIFMGYTYRQLEAAFKAVENPKDWKGPVFGYVRGDAVGVTVAAIAFYTATEPNVALAAGGWYCVSAIGYRMGPAGDH